MNLEDIKKFLEENADSQDVKGYLQELSKVTVSGATAFLETEDGKRLLQPKLDSYHTKSLESWKHNNLAKLVEEEYKKKNPPENALERKLHDLEKQLLLKDLRAQAITVATENKLPISLVDHFIGEDETTTLANLKKLQDTFEPYINERVQEQLKTGGIDLKGNGNPPATITAAQLRTMSRDEIAALDPKVLNEALKTQ